MPIIISIQFTVFIVVFTISNFLIWLFYRTLKLKWPDYYFSATDAVALFVSVSPFRYFAFRLFPPFLLITILLAAFNKSLNPSIDVNTSILIGLISCSFHALINNGLAFLKLLINSDSVKTYFNKYAQMGFHIFTIFLLCIVGVVAGLFSTTTIAIYITPSIEGLVDNTWSSVIAIVLFFYAEKIYRRNDDVDLEKVFKKSMNKVGADLLKYIDEISKKHSANATLVKAVCLVENLQRPKWLRQIENIKAFLKRDGTYGIMQVRVNKYINDKESIEIAISKWFKNTKTINSVHEIEKIAKTYNNDPKYVDLISRAYMYLMPLYED